MGVTLTVTAGLVLWIVLWALGSKPFDAFLLTILITVIGASARIVAPLLPGNRGQ